MKRSYVLIALGLIAAIAVVSTAVAGGLNGPGANVAKKKKGPRGPAGPAGPPGAAGANGVSGYQVITATAPYNSTSPKTTNPSCPAGKQLLGGGTVITHDSSGDPIALTGDGPNPLGSSTTWFAEGVETTATGSSWNMQTTIYCGNP